MTNKIFFLSDIFGTRQYAHTDESIGKPNGNAWYTDNQPFYRVYIGVINPLRWKIFHAYKAGIRYTRAEGKYSYGYTRAFYYNSLGDVIGIEGYQNTFRSIGLELSLIF